MAQPAPSPERKRVKVYELKDNDWFDRGTGYSTTQNIFDEGRILIESEEDPERTLLEVEIRKEDAYQKQQETLIVWTDNDGIDMALSYQEADGAAAVWAAINAVQQRLGDDSDDMPLGPLNLPAPELGNLPHIEDVMRRASQTQMGRDTMIKMVLQDDYIAKLIPVVETAEDLEDLPDLHRLCNIMKTLILFNDNAIIEHVVTDDIVLGVVGALEYDPDFPSYKANHRQYLSDASKFKEVVPIQDPDVRRKIHFTYRLQYLKDVVLARVLDDPTFSVLNSLIFFNQVDIVNHLQSNAEYLKQIFALLSSSDASTQKKKDAVLLIQQSCAIAKNLQPPGRAQLYQNLIGNGLFQTITFALQHQDAAVRVAGTDILVAVIDQDPIIMRNHIIKAINEKQKPMTETLIELLLVEIDVGVKAQIADAIKVLLDPNANVASPPERPMGGDNSFMSKYRGNITSAQQNENFLENFYGHSADMLFQPLKDLERRTDLTNLNANEVTTFTHLVEILCFFLRQHSFRGKYYILSKGFHQRVAQLLCCSQKHLKLSAIKYFRAVISIHDEFHNRQLISLHLLAPVLHIITSTMPRDNLLNSAALDLFEFIRRESLKPLIYHLAEHYHDVLQSITYVDTFHNILLRYEQYQNPTVEANGEGVDSSFMTSEADTPNTKNVTINGGTRWQGLREDLDQEAYFNTSDDEDDDEDELSRSQTQTALSNGLGPSPPMKPLVDYADDDDDDDDVKPVVSGNAHASPKKTDSDEDVPSTSTSGLTSPTAGMNTPPSSAASPSALSDSMVASRPPPKRQRDDEDDDELSKLSAGVKRRNSGRVTNLNAGSKSPNVTVGTTERPTAPEDDQARPADDADAPVAAAAKKPASAPTRHSARKAKAALNGKEHDASNGAGAGAGDADDPPDEPKDARPRKISISLGPAASAAAKKDRS